MIKTKVRTTPPELPTRLVLKANPSDNTDVFVLKLLVKALLDNTLRIRRVSATPFKHEVVLVIEDEKETTN